jgi:hypothetical protein
MMYGGYAHGRGQQPLWRDPRGLHSLMQAIEFSSVFYQLAGFLAPEERQYDNGTRKVF